MTSATPLTVEPSVSTKVRILIANSLDDRYGSTYRLRAFRDNLASSEMEVTYVASEANAFKKLIQAVSASLGPYDLLVTQKFNPITLAVIAIAKLRGKPVLVDWDDLDVGLQNNFFKKWISRFCEWIGPRMATQITTHSQEIQKLAAAMGIEAELIEQGFPEELCRPSEQAKLRLRKKWGFLENDIVVGHMCTLTYGGTLDLKGILDAWARISDPKVRFMLIGGGPMEEQLYVWLKELGLTQRVKVTGLLPQAEAIDLLNALDVGVVFMSDLPGNRERVSLKALEYLAMNIPVVGKLTGESNRLFGKYIHPCDLPELPEAISKLVKNRERTDTSRHVSQYQWSRIAPRLRYVVMQTMKKKSPCR